MLEYKHVMKMFCWYSEKKHIFVGADRIFLVHHKDGEQLKTTRQIHAYKTFVVTLFNLIINLISEYFVVNTSVNPWFMVLISICQPSSRYSRVHSVIFWQGLVLLKICLIKLVSQCILSSETMRPCSTTVNDFKSFYPV